MRKKKVTLWFNIIDPKHVPIMTGHKTKKEANQSALAKYRIGLRKLTFTEGDEVIDITGGDGDDYWVG